jgi:hypothetical protein
MRLGFSLTFFEPSVSIRVKNAKYEMIAGENGKSIPVQKEKKCACFELKEEEEEGGGESKKLSPGREEKISSLEDVKKAFWAFVLLA